MSKSTNALTAMFDAVNRNHERAMKMRHRETLLDSLISDDDMHESLEIRENIAREIEAHSH